MEHLKRLKEKTILLVEDEAVIRNNIASMLRVFFKDVYTAKDGFEGLDRYENHHPDIVMTDLKMPYMGGFELLDELKKRSSSAYMIVVSAHTDTELLINAVNNGIDRYIIKPVTETQMFEAFNAYLEKTGAETSGAIQLSSAVLFDADNHQIVIEGTTIHLNNKETLLLDLLSQDKNRTFTYDEIEMQVWQGRSMSLPALRSVVRDLKKKTKSQLIQNISGTGYRLYTE